MLGQFRGDIVKDIGDMLSQRMPTVDSSDDSLPRIMPAVMELETTGNEGSLEQYKETARLLFARYASIDSLLCHFS